VANTNCLAGFKCPECGFEDCFRIEITTMIDVYDDGTEGFVTNTEWDRNSTCICVNCDKIGKVSDFYASNRLPE